ncbi:MAG: hypothetical protein N2645_20200 [Clostridia bacterium]|nr:hypothetical protein [Clostridia bacterium]
MNKTLDAIIKKYGVETVIARLLEQLRILADSDSGEVKTTIKNLLSDLPSDTEYIYTLCEYTNLVTYTSGSAVINDSPWKEEETRRDLLVSEGDDHGN